MTKFSELFLNIANMSLTAGLLVPVVLLVRAALAKAPKSFSYALWGIVGFRLICPFSISSVFSMFNLPFVNERTSFGNAAYWNGALRTQNLVLPEMAARIAERSSGISVGNLQGTNVQSKVQSGIQEHMQPSKYSGDGNLFAEGKLSIAGIELGVTEFLACIWLAGLMIFLVYEGISWLRLKKQVSQAVKYGDAVYECDEIRAPFVMGILNPAIYIPFRLSGEERAYILLHEQYHIRRKDYLVKFAAVLLLTVYWFNPLIWIAFRGMCRDMEMSCDEWVVKKLGNTVKKSYSGSLLSFAMGHKIPVVSPLAFGESAVKSRVKNILRFQKSGKGTLIAAVLICAAAVIFGVTNEKATSFMKYQDGKVSDAGGAGIKYRVSDEINSFLIYKEIYDEGRFVDYEVLQYGSFGRGGMPRRGTVTLRSSSSYRGKDEWKNMMSWKVENGEWFDNEVEIGRDEYNQLMEQYLVDMDSAEKKHKIKAEEDIVMGVWHLGRRNSGIRAFPCESLMGEDAAVRRTWIGENDGLVAWHVVFSEKDVKELCAEYEPSPFAKELYALQTPYIGDASAVGMLLQAMNISSLGTYTMELQTKEEPYILKVNFKEEPENAEKVDKEMYGYARILLALIGNAGEVQWTYPMESGEILYTGYCNLADVNGLMNKGDIKEFSGSVHNVQEMLDYLGENE